MFFGNSDPTLITISLLASRREAESPTQVFKTLKTDLFRHLVIPSRTFLHVLWEKISRTALTSRRSNILLREPRLLNSRQADFELLAAYPVDRANPPVSQRVRFMKSRQTLLHERLQPGTIQMRPECSDDVRSIEEAKEKQAKIGAELVVLAQIAAYYACQQKAQSVLAEKK
jgi:hypothetical protein